MRKFAQAEKEMYIETAKSLKGHQKRLYMARVVKALGYGGQEYASRELGWNRNTIRKGQRELETGFRCVDNYQARGRKRTEERLPNLLEDIRAIADHHSQTDPSFQSDEHGEQEERAGQDPPDDHIDSQGWSQLSDQPGSEESSGERDGKDSVEESGPIVRISPCGHSAG